ncbi:hypothetical protein G9A89_000168, partial [Geosiphon pyriformis]
MGYATLDAALTFPISTFITSSLSSFSSTTLSGITHPPAGSSILITDTAVTSGDFLLHHFIVNQIKSGRHIVLIGFAQIAGHYIAIGRKLGVNLTQAHEKSTFSFIDGLTSLFSTSLKSRDTKDTITTSILANPTTPISTSSSSSTSLNDIYKIIKDVINMRHKDVNSHLVLIFDDLSVLVYAGYPVRDIMEFFKACRILCEKYNGSLITLIHDDPEAFLSEDTTKTIPENIFIKSLQYQSEYILAVRGLGTGFSRDVSGELTIARGPRNFDRSYRPNTLQYKILDNN